MTDYVVPTGWKYDGSNSGNQTTFTLPGHTVSAPRLVIFDRRVPVVTSGSTVTPSYRIRVIRGIIDAEGKPNPSRAVLDLTIRWPLEATSADIIADIGVLAAMLSDANLPQDIVEEQLLPR